MYKFYYEYLKPKYNDQYKLLFTDTDSLCCQIETPDLHEDMGEAMDLFDTSNFEPNHPLYSKKNHRVLGKMKSETGSTPPLEFVGLRAKMYSLSSGNKSQTKVKGIKKNYVKKNVRHESFLKVLHNTSSTTSAKFRLFRSTNHVINTIEMNSKLIPNLYGKTHYVTHYRNLQFYIRQGLVLTKIHKIISFAQRPWLQPWISLCTTQRQNAQSDFEADLAKFKPMLLLEKLWSKFVIAKI